MEIEYKGIIYTIQRNKYESNDTFYERMWAVVKQEPVTEKDFEKAVYNSNSAGMHRDGRFNQVDISMAFTETRALTKADIRDGGY